MIDVADGKKGPPFTRVRSLGRASLLQIESPWERAPSNHPPKGTPNAVSGQSDSDWSIRNHAVTVNTSEGKL
jgi:hypothetical protein